MAIKQRITEVCRLTLGGSLSLVSSPHLTELSALPAVPQGFLWLDCFPSVHPTWQFKCLIFMKPFLILLTQPFSSSPHCFS